ncbi:hypothetical protein R6Q57_018476 [Mikania cordata]
MNRRTYRARGSQRIGFVGAVLWVLLSLRWNPSGPPSPLTISIMGLTAGLFNAGKDGAIWPDFKKIKEWESQITKEAESFWAMRNDMRRERKLPGFFDREVYDIGMKVIHI